MAGPFKMKGSPMARNFGIASPIDKQKDLGDEKGTAIYEKEDIYTREEFDANQKNVKKSAYDQQGKIVLKEGSDEQKKLKLNIQRRKSDYFANYNADGSRKK